VIPPLFKHLWNWYSELEQYSAKGEKITPQVHNMFNARGQNILTFSMKSGIDNPVLSGVSLRPVIISMTITPKLNMSDFFVIIPLCKYSGAM